MTTMQTPVPTMVPTEKDMQYYTTRPIGTATIVSIYPMEVAKDAFHIPWRWSGPGKPPAFTRFTIPPAERGKYQTLVVEDGYEWQKDLSQVGPEQPSPSMKPAERSAYAMALSLVHYWTSGTLSEQGSPGIGVLPPGVMTPDKVFLDRLTAAQTAMAQYLLRQANDMEAQGKRKHITNLHRSMVMWLMGDAARNLSWFKEAVYAETKKCVRCRMEIDSEATSCRHCQADLVEWYTKLGVEPESDMAVSFAMQALKAAKYDKIAKAKEPVADLTKEAYDALLLRPQNDWTAEERKAFVRYKVANPEEKG